MANERKEMYVLIDEVVPKIELVFENTGQLIYYMKRVFDFFLIFLKGLVSFQKSDIE